MRILVTGSSGFVGQRIVDVLRKRGHWIREFDFKKGEDILDIGQCKSACDSIDIVLHLAAVLDEHSPLLDKVNINGTENLIKAAVENKVSRFILMSSVGVYGDCEEIKTEESELNPKTRYEKSKVLAEHLLNEYQELITINILRPAIILGQNEYWEKIIQLIKKDFPLIGNGENKWQMIYITDLVNALVFVIEHKKAAGEILNIAEESPHSLKEVIIEIRKALGMNKNQKSVPTFIGKILAYFYLVIGKLFGKKSIVSPEHLDRLTRGRWYSIEKIRALGWKPSYDTREAIARTVFEILEKEKKMKK